MTRHDFLNLIYSYAKTNDNTIKEQILTIAADNPLWLINLNFDKSIWDVGASLLIELDYSIIKDNLLSILVGFQDTNWPGVFTTITDYLVTIPKTDLIDAISKTLPKAENDECWLFGLVSLMVHADVLDVFQSNNKYNELIIKSNYF